MLDKHFYKSFLKKSFTIPVKVEYWDASTEVYGEGNPNITIKFYEKIPVQSLIDNASLTLGEAYMDKKIDVIGPDDALEQLMTSAYSNSESFMKSLDFRKFIPKLGSHSQGKSKADISSHYDIGNDFYRLWLDKTMTYSGAYFKKITDDLYTAQINKIHHILNKLYLTPKDTLLDIGCGWGTLILTAAKEYQVKATGITLSQEQYNFVSHQIKEQGLEKLVTVELIDYRNLSGRTFDHVVSVGMVEHVGPENLAVYFKDIQKLLVPKGNALIQGITRQQGGATNAWLNKYIFPGGYVAGLGEMIQQITTSDLQVIDVESLRRHYEFTIEHWMKNFHHQLSVIEKNHEERFIRMWDLYLQACAASFESGNIDLMQYLVTNGVNNQLPITRVYMEK